MKKKKGVPKRKKLIVSAEKLRELNPVDVKDVSGGLIILSGTCCVCGSCGSSHLPG